MNGAHLNDMTYPYFKAVVAMAVVFAAMFAAGCTSTGTTGDSSPARNSRGGGWENFRG